MRDGDGEVPERLVGAANGPPGGNEPLSGTESYGHAGTPNATAAVDGFGGGAGSAGATIAGGNGQVSPDGGGTPSGGGGAGWIRMNTGCLTTGQSSIISPSMSPQTTCATQGQLTLH